VILGGDERNSIPPTENFGGMHPPVVDAYVYIFTTRKNGIKSISMFIHRNQSPISFIQVEKIYTYCNVQTISKQACSMSLFILKVAIIMTVIRKSTKSPLVYWEFELGPFLRPNDATTLTNRRLYCMRRFARPVFFFFFSPFSTFGVCPFTFPARANEP